MFNPTSLIQPYTAIADQVAKLELDETSSLAPGDYIHWLAHIPPGASLVKPFYSSDSGTMQLLEKPVILDRSQAGLVLDDASRSVNLDYYPTGTPSVVFFGNKIALDVNKLRSGLVLPQNSYNGKKVYKFNIYYQVKFYTIRHLPNHPSLISEADGGILWEDYKGSGNLKSFPVEVRAFWE